MRVYNDFDLKLYNSYRVNSKCRTAYFPENENDLVELYTSNKEYILLGSGHNIILSKDYYNENFIIFNGNYDAVEVDVHSNVISAEAGATILEVSEAAEKHSLAGVEFFYDIPSSVGGAVVMNAGTKEGETKNVLQKVRYLDLIDMCIKEKVNEELELEYRNSIFQKQKDKVILKAWFQLSSGNQSKIRRIMNESKERRWSKQPREFPNSGSVFKRPPGCFVGPMIDELGLKGFTIGGAQVSKKHSGFIVNVNNASGSDIIEIIKHTQSKVKEKYNIDLEIEQRII
ncbi:UDP-N-acetylmuramate dehydrogenase [Winogradskyella psychrotolerans]|uniref:UDP-N-acetylmuramate dehydrogenase n=1 Tax=Winogradskyella psychrotolerans TaxID=1344585 RepID=UPI001C07B638|nr:UDP-N-acetylmuramate dehydrogenase [Winogradskyella psychrotolerans]MBU2922158.1 UDP-N-acetylmuramate dehydrogenase [Winogradskyella psychrotolerans]